MARLLKRENWLVGLLALVSWLWLTGCTAPAQTAPPATTVGHAEPTLPVSATPQPTVQPEVAAQAEATPLPPSPATTPNGPLVRITRSMNLRGGPGTNYPVVGSANAGDSFAVVGVNGQGDWWQIALADRVVWVYGPLVTAEGTDGVPVAEAPPLPTQASTQPPAPTPQPDDGNAGSAPAPAPVGTVVVYETSVTLPTYPYERYLSDAVNETFNWPYKRFDRERYQRERPGPENRQYKVLVLENAYLKLTVLPELGGRIWQVIHKPTGANLFYQNPVVKPSPWGPPEQLGWLAVGGLEWSLPVVEHGYDWGVPWGYSPLQHSPELASITVFTPRDGRYLSASVKITLRAGAASFDVEPSISNISDRTLNFAFWETALLAPGTGNKPSGSTHFLLPGSQMTVHSTGDSRLPGPGQPFEWPVYNGVDYSWLGNYQQWLGFFERPAAHGPYAAIYDTAANAGAVRIYPASITRGSKAFALGWHAALGSDNFTDDGSAYVELHGGLSPTFDDTYRLPAGGVVGWREVWYPISAIGGLSYADEVAAIHLAPDEGGLRAGFYPTRPLDGVLVAATDSGDLARVPIKASPDAPFVGRLLSREQLPATGPLLVRLEDGSGRVLYETIYSGPLR
ncbi:MAG: DUF5107 domain-containing protein [Caldilineaceae bacterium]